MDELRSNLTTNYFILLIKNNNFLCRRTGKSPLKEFYFLINEKSVGVIIKVY